MIPETDVKGRTLHQGRLETDYEVPGRLYDGKEGVGG